MTNNLGRKEQNAMIGSLHADKFLFFFKKKMTNLASLVHHHVISVHQLFFGTFLPKEMCFFSFRPAY